MGEPYFELTNDAIEEAKKISEALKDDSWVETMQEELLQFRLQQDTFNREVKAGDGTILAPSLPYTHEFSRHRYVSTLQLLVPASCHRVVKTRNADMWR
ncbi:hypothetical protein Tco_0949102 [Tanacetum coccineum]